MAQAVEVDTGIDFAFGKEVARRLKSYVVFGYI